MTLDKEEMSRITFKDLERKAFPKGYSKRFDDFTGSLKKKHFFEFMELDKVRGHQIAFLVEDTKKQIIREVLKLIKAWNGYDDDRFPEGEVKELVREIKKLSKIK